MAAIETEKRVNRLWMFLVKRQTEQDIGNRKEG